MFLSTIICIIVVLVILIYKNYDYVCFLNKEKQVALYKVPEDGFLRHHIFYDISGDPIKEITQNVLFSRFKVEDNLSYYGCKPLPLK